MGQVQFSRSTIRASFIFFISGFALSACGGGSGSSVPTVPAEPKNIISLSSSTKGTCAVQAEGGNKSGSLWCWGKTAASIFRLGVESSIQKTPTQVSNLNNIKIVSASGIEHLCVVTIEGELLCLGGNGAGQIGIDQGSVDYQNNPRYFELTPVTPSKDWQTVSTGDVTTCGIKLSGSLWCWGNNSDARLATNDTIGTALYVLKPTPILKSTGVNDDSVWKQISVSGVRHTCGIKQDGSLWCWGSNDSVFGTAVQAEPVIYPKLITQPLNNNLAWIDVTTGNHNVCGIIESVPDTNSGTLWCWGQNLNGAVAQNPATVFTVTAPAQIGSSDNWVKVRSNVNSNGTCAINTEQQLFCWGHNANFQLGVNASSDSFTPVLVDAGNNQNWINLAGGQSHTCSVRSLLNSENKKTSLVWCWGANNEAQLGNGKTNLSLLPKKIYPSADIAGIPAKWTDITGSGTHYCALKEEIDGKSAWCWGNNAFGLLGINSKYRVSIPFQEFTKSHLWQSISGYGNACGIQSDKSFWCWWQSSFKKYLIDYNQRNDPTYKKLIPNKINLLSRQWKSTAIGNSHTCGLDINDEIFCWGDSTVGQSGTATLFASANVTTLTAISTPNQSAGTNTKWQSLSSADETVCGIRANDQSLWCWGSTEHYQFLDIRIVDDARLKKNEIGEAYSDIPIAIEPGSRKWLSVSVMFRAVCAIDVDSHLYCWGLGDRGYLGIDTEADSTTYSGNFIKTPTLVNTQEDSDAGLISEWKKITKSFGLCGIKSDDSLWCTGNNRFGQLGINRDDLELVKTMVQVLPKSKNWLSVASTGVEVLSKSVSLVGTSTCGIKLDNTLWCWGKNDFGQLGDGTVFVTTPEKVKIP